MGNVRILLKGAGRNYPHRITLKPYKINFMDLPPFNIEE
jgi:hypothetical protein